MRMNGTKNLLVSCMQANTLSIYYKKLDDLNYDEQLDTIPNI